MFRKFAFNVGGEAVGFLRQAGKPCGVDGIGAAVMGAEGYVAFVLVVDETFDMATVQRLQGVAVEFVVADPVEKINEFAVRLAVDMLQFDGDQFGSAQGIAAEKIGGVVVGLEDAPIGVFHHRRQLMQVADEQQLHPAERHGAAAMAAENTVHPVQQVGADHADLVDHQKIEAFNEIDLVPAEFMAVFALAAGNERPERHLKKGMESDAAGIDRRHPGRGGDDHAFRALLFDVVQKGRLAGAGLAGQKNIAAGVPDKFVGELQQRVRSVHRFCLRIHFLQDRIDQGNLFLAETGRVVFLVEPILILEVRIFRVVENI